MIGLCARFGWLPSLAEAEDWAQLNEVQSRAIRDDAETEHAAWEQQVRSEWNN